MADQSAWLRSAVAGLQSSVGNLQSSIGDLQDTVSKIPSGFLQNPRRFIISTVAIWLVSTFILKPALFTIGTLRWAYAMIAAELAGVQPGLEAAIRGAMSGLLSPLRQINIILYDLAFSLGLGAPIAVAFVIVAQFTLVVALLAGFAAMLPGSDFLSAAWEEIKERL